MRRLSSCLLALLPLLLLLGKAGSVDLAREHDLVGWLGETYELGNATSASASQQPSSGMVVLSWEPRIFLYRGFLTDAECDELIEKSTPRLFRSGVSDSITGQGKTSDIRTSSGMFFGLGEYPVVKRVEERIARWSMTHVQQGEGIQVLKYEKTQKYEPHHDYFSHEHGDDSGGNRLCTGLMYLSNVEEGGETVFPKVPLPKGQTKEAGYSDCAMKGLAYKPRKGDIVLFWSIRTDGTFEPKSLHGSCPVIKGQKWSATKWIHVAKISAGTVHRVMYVPPPPPDVPGCINKNKLCPHWAEAGECEDNPGYMIGSKEKPGECIKACHRCDLGPNDDGAPGQAMTYV